MRVFPGFELLNLRLVLVLMKRLRVDFKDGPFDKIINYTRNVIIRTHGDYFSQTKAASGLNRSIGCVEILYGL